MIGEWQEVSMGRKPRVFYCGALYHIIQRGNNKSYIYEDISDKKMFFKLVLEARAKYSFKILYYVLMDNHYHMIIEAGNIPISKAIQRLHTAYSKYYNKKYNRTGSIYSGRYTASLITDTRYYLQLLKYIANNPVKANIVKNAGDYRWSAHASIKAGDSSIVDIDRMLSYFPSPKPKVMEEYIVKSDYGLVPVKEEQKLLDSLDYLLKSLNFSEDVFIRIKQGDKRSDIKAERDCFIRKAYETGFKIKEIANYISFTYEGVRKIL